MLCYHAVSEVWPAELSVHPEALERQLRFLLDRGYQPATFTELVTHGTRRKSFAVTFDDGFVSVGKLAGPILGRLGIAGTVFVVTDHVGAAAPMTWPGIEQWLKTPHEPELLPLGWDDLRDLQSAGWEIGAHTCSHPHLTQVPAEHLEHELNASRRICTERLGVCTSIAYPYGDVDARVVEAARQAGYTAGASLPARWGAGSKLDWPRVGIWQSDDFRRFRLKTSHITRALRRCVRR